MKDSDKGARFEQVVIPHLDAAYNLARWLLRDDQDAQDVVQESCLRAFKFIGGFRGSDGRAWLLAIVRNTSYTWLGQHRAQELRTSSLDEEKVNPADEAFDVEALLHQKIDHKLVQRALEDLPLEFREAIVLKDIEGFSYKEIAGIANIPIGTVMSRIARARTRLQQRLSVLMKDE